MVALSQVLLTMTTEIGFLDSTSAGWFVEPGRWMMENWKACSSRDHLLSHWDRDLLDFAVFNHSRGCGWFPTKSEHQ